MNWKSVELSQRLGAFHVVVPSCVASCMSALPSIAGLALGECGAGEAVGDTSTSSELATFAMDSALGSTTSCLAYRALQTTSAGINGDRTRSGGALSSK